MTSIAELRGKPVVLSLMLLSSLAPSCGENEFEDEHLAARRILDGFRLPEGFEFRQEIADGASIERTFRTPTRVVSAAGIVPPDGYVSIPDLSGQEYYERFVNREVLAQWEGPSPTAERKCIVTFETIDAKADQSIPGQSLTWLIASCGFLSESP